MSEVRRKEGLVNSIYGKEAPKYLSFFPQGLSLYSNTVKGQQLILFDNIVSQFDTHKTDFPGVAASFITLRTAYLSASSTQSELKGFVGGSKTSRDLIRLNLANNAHEMWLNIALNNMGKPEIVKVFFNVSIFDKGTNYDNDGVGLIKVASTDLNGKPLINAKLEIKDLEGKIIEQGIADDNVFYESGNLGINFYDVSVSQIGFISTTSRFQVFDNRDPLHEIKLASE